MNTIETETFLSHYGVKGMKWGVRKAAASARFNDIRNGERKTLELKTKSGETVTVTEGKKPLVSALLSAASPRIYEGVKNSTSVTLSANGKKIGAADFNFQGKNREELYLNMIQIDSKQRGKGYASTCMDAAVELGRAEGAKRITLDVPDNAPDARHIYEKLGFRQSGPTERSPDFDAMWGGGLTPMKLDISSETIKHADPDYNDVSDGELEEAFDQHYKKLLLGSAGDEMQQADADDFLAHYGIKGMKWGRRRTDAQLERAAGGRSTDSADGEDRPQSKIDKKKVAVGVAATVGVLAVGAAIGYGAVVSSNKRKEGEEYVAQQVKAYAKKSMWEIASSTPPPPQHKKSAPKTKPSTRQPSRSASKPQKYSARAQRKDTKLYGEKAAKRINKKVAKGVPLSEARQREAVRKYGGTALKVAVNVNSSKARENLQTSINRRRR